MASIKEQIQKGVKPAGTSVNAEDEAMRPPPHRAMGVVIGVVIAHGCVLRYRTKCRPERVSSYQKTEYWLV